MNTFDNSLFEDIKTVRERDDDMEDALERLVESPHFGRTPTFYSQHWELLRPRAEARERGLYLDNRDTWKELLRPVLFLAICEVSDEEWIALWEADVENPPKVVTDSEVYYYIRNAIRNEIQKHLLDGKTLYQDELHGEQSWPTEDEDPFEPDLDFFEAPRNIEEDAINSLVAAQIREVLTDDEYDILMAEYGDDPELAEQLGVSEGTIRMRRFHLRRRLQREFGNG